MGCSSSIEVANGEQVPRKASKTKQSKRSWNSSHRVHPAQEYELGESHAKDTVVDLADDTGDDDSSTAASSRSASRASAKRPGSSDASTSHVEALSDMALPTIWLRKMFVDAPDYPFIVLRVYAFLPWSQRGDAMCISRGLRRFFNAHDVYGEYWRWCCECLCDEALLVLPRAALRPLASANCTVNRASLQIGNGRIDYRALLAELWPLRFRFADAATSAAAKTVPEKYSVNTFCKLRPVPPATLDGTFCENMLSTPVTLPLGQRVALLRQRHPHLTRAAAMKMFLNKKCGAGEPLEEDDDFLNLPRELREELGESRPPTAARPQTGYADAAVALDVAASCGSGFTASVLSVAPGKEGWVTTVSPGIGIRRWNFSHVFGESTSQQMTYEICGHRLTTNLINGQSGSLICYGQTGSGKTHTMFGPPNVADGLIPRIVDEVLTAAEARRAQGFKVAVGASFIEVFGQDVSNILGKTGVAKLCERMGTKYVLDGKYEHPVRDRDEFASLLTMAEERKRKAHTEMNSRSTRAHTLVLFRVRQRAPRQGPETTVESVLSLVDLGGSERVTKSKANDGIRAPGAVKVGDDEMARVSWQDYYKSRERITETNNINKGLLALKRCVQALNERQKRQSEGRPLVRVPFTDAKLTMLLQPALSGHGMTSIVICASQEERHAEETVQSLRFGEMCSHVVQDSGEEAHGDVSAVVAETVRQIDAEIKELEAIILSKEKWEWKKAIREDVIDEKDTGGTVCNNDEVMELGGAGAVQIHADDGASKKRVVEHEVWSQVLVGAEAENARRDELLKKRQQLLGLE